MLYPSTISLCHRTLLTTLLSNKLSNRRVSYYRTILERDVDMDQIDLPCACTPNQLQGHGRSCSPCTARYNGTRTAREYLKAVQLAANAP